MKHDIQKRGFTLVEIIIAAVAATILFAGVCGVYQYAIRRWDVQSSYGLAVGTADTALERIQKEARNAISFSTTSDNGNSIYIFTLPANAIGQQYEPACSGGMLQYVAGPRVAFYLSDNTGSQSINNGSVIWRATAPAGSNTFTPDSSWSLSNANVARCGGVRAFSITTTGMPANTVSIDVTITDTSTRTGKTYSVSREQFMANNNSSATLGGCSTGSTTGSSSGSTTGSTTGSSSGSTSGSTMGLSSGTTSGSTTGSSSGSTSGSTTGSSSGGCSGGEDNGKGNNGCDNGNHGNNNGQDNGDGNGNGNGNHDGGDGGDNGNGNQGNDNGNHDGGDGGDNGNGNQGNDNGNH